MKPRTLALTRILLPVLILTTALCLVSWDISGSGKRYATATTDTVPKAAREKKIRNLDEALEDMDRADWKADLEKAKEELARAIKEIDSDKIRLEMDKAMASIDVEKIRKEAERAVKDIDWNKIEKELQSVKEMNWDKFQDNMKEMQENLKKMGPELEQSMEKLKVEMEHLKEEMKGYKTLVDGLDADGYLDKKKDYKLEHRNGELKVNGKALPAAEYNKFRSFLEKHEKFTVNKNDDDDFNINND